MLPVMFTKWEFETHKLIVTSIQVIMLGMDTKLNIRDFIKELSKPPVAIARSVMVFFFIPLAAILIFKTWNSLPEGIAGIIPSGA